MKTLKYIITFYKDSGGELVTGLTLAALAILCASLLTVISGWFITATALAGVGIISLQTYNLFLPSAAIRFLALGRPLAKYSERLFNHKVTFKLISASRSRTFAQLLTMEKTRLIAFRGTDLAARLTGDIDKMDQFYTGFLLPWFSTTIIFIISLIYLLFIAPSVALVVIFMYLFSGVLIPFLALRTALKKGTREVLLYELQAEIADFASGHLELKSFGMFEKCGANIRQVFSALSSQGHHSSKQKGLFNLLQGILLQSGILATLVILFRFHLPQTYGPMLVLIMFAVIAMSEILQPLSELFFNQAAMFNAAGRIGELHEKKAAAPVIKQPLNRLSCQDITMENLCFSYSKRNICNQLSVVFEYGKTYVIQGPNGSGKSTLFDLISGLQQPQGGSLKIGGVDNDGLPDLFRSSLIGYMEQQLSLFEESIYRNIAIGNPEADANTIIAAAQRAGLGPMIEMLADGVFSIIEEDHRNLSGGQARMVCLARLILKDAPILLFDEPTESLDAIATQNFINLVNDWKGKKTIIIITHKQIPLLDADEYYLMKEGKITHLNK